MHLQVQKLLLICLLRLRTPVEAVERDVLLKVVSQSEFQTWELVHPGCDVICWRLLLSIFADKVCDV